MPYHHLQLIRFESIILVETTMRHDPPLMARSKRKDVDDSWQKEQGETRLHTDQFLIALVGNGLQFLCALRVSAR